MKTAAVSGQRGNISENSTKDDVDTSISNILTKINEECKDGGCKFSESLKTLVEERWGEIVYCVFFIFNSDLSF